MDKNNENYRILPEFHLTAPGVPVHVPIIAENIQIYFRETAKPTSSNTFCHDKHVLIFCLAGTRIIRINREKFKIMKNEIFIVPALCYHSYDGSVDYESIMISFTLAPNGAGLESIVKKNLPTLRIHRKKIDQCVKNFLEWYHNQPGADAECCYLVSSLLNNLKNKYGLEYSESQTYIDHEQVLLKKAIDIINSNLNRKQTIEEIAGKLNISPGTLRLMFRKNINISLGRYIKIRCLNRIYFLLRSSSLTLAEIAQQTGYQSESSLIRAFKQETGQTPIASRKNYRTPAIQ